MYVYPISNEQGLFTLKNPNLITRPLGYRFGFSKVESLVIGLHQYSHNLVDYFFASNPNPLVILGLVAAADYLTTHTYRDSWGNILQVYLQGAYKQGQPYFSTWV